MSIPQATKKHAGQPRKLWVGNEVVAYPGAYGVAPPTAPVRPPPAIKPPTPPEGARVTACQRLAAAARGSTDATMARPHHGVRHRLPVLA